MSPPVQPALTISHTVEDVEEPEVEEEASLPEAEEEERAEVQTSCNRRTGTGLTSSVNVTWMKWGFVPFCSTHSFLYIKTYTVPSLFPILHFPIVSQPYCILSPTGCISWHVWWGQRWPHWQASHTLPRCLVWRPLLQKSTWASCCQNKCTTMVVHMSEMSGNANWSGEEVLPATPRALH